MEEEIKKISSGIAILFNKNVYYDEKWLNKTREKQKIIFGEKTVASLKE